MEEKWYNVHAAVTGSKYLGRFKAKNAEEAEEKALKSNEAFISFCHFCAHECVDAEVSELFIELDINQNDKK